MDETEFERWIGGSNRAIVSNFTALCKSNVPFCVRVPMVPGVTDTEENIQAIAQIMRSHHADMVELMPYNRMAGGKYKMTGRVYNPAFNEHAELEYHTNIFAQNGIQVKIL
jgi:pyruvate formate lyase activating enzyme